MLTPVFSLPVALGVFVAAAAVIVVAGTRLTRVADRLADRTGIGEALTGAVLLGASTSLPGLVTTVVTAADGLPEFAVSHAIGGIAAQTVFLAIADATYRDANLEHAAASTANAFSAVLLVAMLALVLVGASGPDMSVLGVHLLTPLLVAAYLYGLRLTRLTDVDPMWRPTATPQTRVDEPDEEAGGSIASLAGVFAVLGLTVGVAGWAVARAGVSIAETTPLTETVVGGLFTAVATSLPELVTTLAAVRQGSLTLAVGGIIGGNTFDVLFIAVADVAYREGSIYHAFTAQQTFMVAMTILLTAVLVAGLVRRERHGPGNLGFESLAILLLYGGGFLLLSLS